MQRDWGHPCSSPPPAQSWGSSGPPPHPCWILTHLLPWQPDGALGARQTLPENRPGC